MVESLDETDQACLDFYHYRRALFLSSTPLPTSCDTSSSRTSTGKIEFPPTYKVKRPPPPYPSIQSTAGTNATSGPAKQVQRIEQVLSKPGAEESQKVWDKIKRVWGHLDSGQRLNYGLRLGLVIKILRASWIQDGTWPIDPFTKRAYIAPESPIISSSPSIPIDPFAPADDGDLDARPASRQ